MPLSVRSGQSLTKVLQSFDPDGKWAGAIEGCEITRGSAAEYGRLADNLLDLYGEEDIARLRVACSEAKGLPVRFRKAVDPHFVKPRLPAAATPADFVPVPTPGSGSKLAEIIERLSKLELMVAPLVLEKGQRAAALDESGKLLRAANARMDEVPKLAPVVRPVRPGLGSLLPR